jgi:hypothetical protein
MLKIKGARLQHMKVLARYIFQIVIDCDCEQHSLERRVDWVRRCGNGVGIEFHWRISLA